MAIIINDKKLNKYERGIIENALARYQINAIDVLLENYNYEFWNKRMIEISKLIDLVLSDYQGVV